MSGPVNECKQMVGSGRAFKAMIMAAVATDVLLKFAVLLCDNERKHALGFGRFWEGAVTLTSVLPGA